MSVLLPWVLGLGALAVAAIVALHLLARHEPPRWMLPTARFVPASRERAPARSLRLSDRRLLALRAVALVAMAIAMAGPWWHGVRVPMARVVIVDLSRTVSDRAAVAAAAWSAARAGDRIVVLDSLPRVVALGPLDTLAAQPAPTRRGRLGAALLLARDQARTLARGADSVALVLVSPLTRDALDPATRAIRASWPGGLAIVRPTAAREDPAPPTPVMLRAAPDDPMRATLALEGRLARSAPFDARRQRVEAGRPAARALVRLVRLVRDGSLSSADSTAARAGAVVVHWPAGLVARDTVGAVATVHAAFVATLPRPAALDGGTPVAWWVDGAVAATETALGAGCVRRVAIPLAPAGDASLRASFRAVARDLLAPCGGVSDARPLDTTGVRLLAGGTAAVASEALLTPTPDRWLVRGLLALAAVALALEWWLRRRPERA